MNEPVVTIDRSWAGLIGIVVALLSFTACAAGDSPAEPSENPTETGRELVDEYVSVLQGGDREELDEFLSESFQLMRSDGSVATKSDYLASPPQVGEATIGDDLVATRDGDVIVVRWSIVVDATTDGGDVAPGSAPRLSTFHLEDGSWRISSHANFAQIE